jgi:acyl-CoA synthetase (AMP-forming)/AMP-acid ligase II
MIISGGVNIYPQECENLLITHPKVVDAAVFGVPNADLGEEVKAVVQLMPGVDAGAEFAEELIAFCREHLAHIKCPRSIDFTAEFCLTSPSDFTALWRPRGNHGSPLHMGALHIALRPRRGRLKGRPVYTHQRPLAHPIARH